MASRKIIPPLPVALSLLVLMGLGGYFFVSQGNQLTTFAAASFVKDSGSIEAHFCPQEPCEKLLIDFLGNAKSSMHCAFYNINLQNLSAFLKEKSKQLDVKLVIDEDNKEKLDGLPIVMDSGYGLMHNKFCVVDNLMVSTGSMNPTVRDTTVNNNNLLFIESKAIAADYEAEFQELWDKQKSKRTPTPLIILNTTAVAVYFCPEDRCASKVISELKGAKHSIYFMTFSFTHAGIANTLLLKKQEGIKVRGVYEKTQVDKDSTFSVLSYQGADVRIDGNKYNLHHKVFIIDNKTVITGSFNPTKNGDERNDENIIIIRSPRIASQFTAEFDKVYAKAIAPAS